MFSRVHYFATFANLLSGQRFRSKSTHGQHLGFALCLGIYSHTVLIIRNLLVIDAICYLNIRFSY